MNLARSLGAIALVVLSAAMPAMSQTGRGTLTGTVVDAQGGVLQGAKVVLDPDGATALTDQTGQFALTGLAARDYTVTITYAGFTPFVQKVNLAGGQSARLAATLAVAENKEEVQVYAGRAGGELEAMNRTVNADNIISVLPADVITSLPNANVADAVGRLASVTLERDEGEGKYVQVRGTEPRLTNTTVDGVNIASAETVRQVKLDIIPADLVESVQINKTLQANMEGDGIGGSVDLRTKSAGDRPTVYLDSTGGHTPIIGGRPVYQFDGTLGRRFMEKKLGVLFGGSYDWNGRGINDVEPGPLFLGGYDERDYQYYRSRKGFAGTIDYRINDASSVYLKGLYSLFDNFGNRWDYNFSTAFDANYSPVAGSGRGTPRRSQSSERKRSWSTSWPRATRSSTWSRSWTSVARTCRTSPFPATSRSPRSCPRMQLGGFSSTSYAPAACRLRPGTARQPATPSVDERRPG